MSIKKDSVQEQALSIIENYKKCSVGISMGVGKTRIGIKHLIKNYHVFIKVLVVIPKLSIKDSWHTELKKMEVEFLQDHITFTTYLSLNKKDPNDYDIVYLDECHNILPHHENFLNNYNQKLLGLSGTLPVFQNSEKYKLIQKHCPTVFKFSVDEATEQKILNDYRIVVHKLNLNKLKTLKKKTKAGKFWYTSEYNDYTRLSNLLEEAETPKQKQFYSIFRMRALMSYPTKEEYLISILNDINDKCIIFANTQEQADRICKHSYHSNNDNSEENLRLFKEGTIKKLSCIAQLNEGVSIPELKVGIIMHSYGNERKSTQRIGRLLRLNPDQISVCHILCYKDSVDEIWVDKALEGLDKSKIEYLTY
jgi:superfamily II DNA or RNA helicase